MAPTTLLCLHGFSQNGAVLRQHIAPLAERFPESLALEFPDAPNECSEASVTRLYAMLDTQRSPPPYRCFWDSTEDGRQYRGWHESLSVLRERAGSSSRLGVLGFSQGASVAASLCALAARGQFPELAFAVLIAGRTPRSDELAPLFDTPLALPSLHVWGERDGFAAAQSPKLAGAFDVSRRAVTIWNGPHVLPTRGPAADAIATFVQAHAG